MTGFVPTGEMLEEGDDDKDGSLGPPPRAPARGGGVPELTRLQLGPGWVPMRLWSSDEENQCGAGFLCAQDLARRVLYAKLETAGTDDFEEDAEVTKSAITTLLDMAEACNSRKITLGLGAEHAASAELICSLLYLGFQVVPSRKSPLVETALLLDFDMGVPDVYGHLSSDNPCTATSECSTSAEDEHASLDDLDSD